LVLFLKTQHQGHLYKKAKVFSSEDVKKMLEIDKDSDFFLDVVIFLFGYYGLLRSVQLLHVLFENIVDSENEIRVKVDKVKTSVGEKIFIINCKKSIDLIHKYFNMFEKEQKKGRIFRYIRNGKIIKTQVGINRIQNATKNLAKMLNKDNPDSFTSHCMRRFFLFF